MANEIYNDWERDAWSWMVATKGRKYITLKYLTIEPDDNNVTIKYNMSDEIELLASLGEYLFDIEAILGFEGAGPKPVKVTIHKKKR